MIENIRFITCEKRIEFYKCQDTLKNHTLLLKKTKNILAQTKKIYHCKNLFK